MRALRFKSVKYIFFSALLSNDVGESLEGDWAFQVQKDGSGNVQDEDQHQEDPVGEQRTGCDVWQTGGKSGVSNSAGGGGSGASTQVGLLLLLQKSQVVHLLLEQHNEVDVLNSSLLEGLQILLEDLLQSVQLRERSLDVLDGVFIGLQSLLVLLHKVRIDIIGVNFLADDSAQLLNEGLRVVVHVGGGEGLLVGEDLAEHWHLHLRLS